MRSISKKQLNSNYIYTPETWSIDPSLLCLSFAPKNIGKTRYWTKWLFLRNLAFCSSTKRLIDILWFQTLQLILNSMHKYQPRVHIIRKRDHTASVINLKSEEMKTFTFPETNFIGVTAYQNQLVSHWNWTVPFNPTFLSLRKNHLIRFQAVSISLNNRQTLE